MRSALFDIYKKYGTISMKEIVKLVGNKHTVWREIFWVSKNLECNKEINHLDELVRDEIDYAISENSHNDAARHLGISERMLSYNLDKYNLRIPKNGKLKDIKIKRLLSAAVKRERVIKWINY